jgi:hypothetical protein
MDAAPPDIILTDIDKLVTITANMIYSFLKQKNRTPELKIDAPQNSTPEQRKISLCLSETINNGAS